VGDAKRIVVQPIDRKSADECVRRWHYSGKPYTKSRLHLGAFLNESLLGVMQFGQSLDPRKLMGLVAGTGWNEFVELNRMAFSDALPRNSESRCLAVAMRLMRKHAPHIKWVVSFADGTQCGDGAIYRASGFLLTGIKPNTALWRTPSGAVVSDVGVRTSTKLRQGLNTDGSTKSLIAAGCSRLEGHQFRCVYFVDATARERLTVPVLPFDIIDRVGAGMYRGEKRSRVRSADSGTTPQE
jgi:hypothetical protein